MKSSFNMASLHAFLNDRSLEVDEKDELSFSISDAFVEITDEGKLAACGEEKVAEYHRLKELVSAVKERRVHLADPAYLRSHPPSQRNGEPWVLVLGISLQEIDGLVSGICDSLVNALEKESFAKLDDSNKLTAERKEILTDELEDRLRTHWPRRGRVETQVKQPREAELLGHQQKTWRHIQAIGQRMGDIQAKFVEQMRAARFVCDAYVNDIVSLRNSLSEGNFRNLAILQGVDMRARDFTIKFQAASSALLAALHKMCNDDTAAVTVFAKDFRKVCPRQVAGVEGGYSDTELEEIGAMVESQCIEIGQFVQEWQVDITQLTEQQEQSLKSHGDFNQKYEKVAQELAMSEGLGQTYGAPRRRAQERIRTEVSRDEQTAGKVDELLAKLDFVLAEAGRQDDGASLCHTEALGAPETNKAGPTTESDLAEEESNGRPELDAVNATWMLLKQIRAALQKRGEFLKVLESERELPSELPWIPADRIPVQQSKRAGMLSPRSLVEAEAKAAAAAAITPTPTTLLSIQAEVDAACRQETRTLYSNEGKLNLLGDGGVPPSLEEWLRGSKEKLLAYRDKAWKRFWVQTERLEVLLARKTTGAPAAAAEEDEEPALGVGATDGSSGSVVLRYHLGIPAVCLRTLAQAFTLYIRCERRTQENKFLKLVRIWEVGREKHERMLRPRLGSADAADELAKLNAVELERSADLSGNIVKFRSTMVRKFADHAKTFVEDVCVCYRSILGLIDSALRQELLQVPPDTEIPKKRMTLKRLRKAQRLRQEVALGATDQSRERVWAALNLDALRETILSSEDMVPDLKVAAEPPPAPEPVAAKGAKGAAKAAAPPAKGKKGEVAPVVAEKPTLLSSKWVEDTKASSSVRAGVSTAHRALVLERDEVVSAYVAQMSSSLDALRARYDEILAQETSWRERWARQVQMLGKGDL